MKRKPKSTRKNIIKDKSLAFAIRVVRLTKWLKKEKEAILGTQLLRAGTAIGALVREAEHGESKKDFVHKMSVALKEANETEYWILLLHECDIIDDKGYESIRKDVDEVIRILASIVKTARRGQRRRKANGEGRMEKGE